MSFQIINVITGEPVYYNGLNTFPTGEVAALLAVSITSVTGIKHQPRRIGNTKWRDREYKRFEEGSYLPLPWVGMQWFDENVPAHHFPHIAVSDPTKIAFTESIDKGMADIQTRMRAGRYLTKFFSHLLSQHNIRLYTLDFAARFEENRLLFAHTADEIEEVYTSGPQSCMGNEDYRSEQGWSPFRSPCHPVRVYAAGDLAVAYLVRKEHIVARALCWPAQKTYSRIYGDEYRIKEHFRTDGWVQKVPLGARILKIPARNIGEHRYVLPYIDAGTAAGGGSLSVIDEGDEKTFTITNDGPGATDASDHLRGYTYIPRYREPEPEGEYFCDQCGNRSYNETVTVTLGRHSVSLWCNRCVEEHATWCREEEIWVRNIFTCAMHDGEFWSEWRYLQEGGLCQATHERHALVDLSPVIVSINLMGYPYTQLWCAENIAQHATMCSTTHLFYANELIVKHPTHGLIGKDHPCANDNGCIAWPKWTQPTTPSQPETAEIAF